MSVICTWEIENSYEEQPFSFDAEALIEELAEEVLGEEGLEYEAEISVLFTDSEGIREINREARGLDVPTDVLSFPMLEYETPGDFSFLSEEDEVFDPVTGELVLGDIVLNIDRVLSQAEEYGHSVRREFAFLVVHSLLHLCGYDHMEEEERLVMEEKQRTVLDRLGIVRGGETC
ncbi:MAG: rRNA maturation RNase YbeY [Lachnospiraceae bacterium]|nr:rRNA maturation RNase YbeY [Lachnospiraceae bacterium]